MATARVMETPELLEMILLQLPVLDVLVSQRVSKFWSTLSSNSIKIQQALFLRPIHKEPGMTHQDCRIVVCDRNMLCSEILGLASNKTVVLFPQRKHEPRILTTDPQNPSRTRMLFCQPILTSELWISSYFSGPDIENNELDTFFLGEPIKIWSDGAKIRIGSVAHIGAFKIEAANGITVDHVTYALDRDAARYRESWPRRQKYSARNESGMNTDDIMWIYARLLEIAEEYVDSPEVT